MTPLPSFRERVIASAMWAALGDALGFITELIDSNGLQQRIGAKAVAGLLPWQRRVGGRFGVDAMLPLGCYSDDTQLRLATGRAIEGNGSFNVEAFSKIELPVFLSYALGAGKGTKRSAADLRKGSVRWNTNFGSGYHEGGGNGAAMRIQPHAWVAQGKRDPSAMLLDVAKNTICTHGHPRGLVGASFHAVAVWQSLRSAAIIGPSEWKDVLDMVECSLFPTMSNEFHISTVWLPEWRRHAGQDFQPVLESSLGECREYVRTATSILNRGGEPLRLYEGVVRALDGLDPKTRGSGTKTAILASACAWIFRDEPRRGLLAAANLLGSDTDTIGTMAGALLGVVAGSLPEEAPADSDYIMNEAGRLADAGATATTPDFRYPDLLEWTPPRSAVDAVGRIGEDGTLALAGIGGLGFDDDRYELKGTNPAVVRWASLPFGQRILVKMRHDPEPLEPGQHPPTGAYQASLRSTPEQESLARPTTAAPPPQGSLDGLTQQAIDSRFDPATVGRCLLAAASSDHGVENAIAFAAIIAKARIARQRREEHSRAEAPEQTQFRRGPLVGESIVARYTRRDGRPGTIAGRVEAVDKTSITVTPPGQPGVAIDAQAFRDHERYDDRRRAAARLREWAATGFIIHENSARAFSSELHALGRKS